jgi:hypothetical protein
VQKCRLYGRKPWALLTKRTKRTEAAERRAVNSPGWLNPGYVFRIFYKAPEERPNTTSAYRPARVGGGGHFRAEALRASRLYPVNYKFVPPGTRNGSRRGGASRGGANAALDGAGEYHESVPPGTRW